MAVRSFTFDLYQVSGLSGKKKPQGFDLVFNRFGGDKRDRTADLLNAILRKVILSCLP